MNGSIQRRYKHHGSHAQPHILADHHPAMTGLRTIYPSTVRSANPHERVLKSGINSRKLGDRIGKGAWAGSPLFSLKLEERRTCPVTCQQFASCYGNNIGRKARRWNVDSHLYTRLIVELENLSFYNRWYVIRLHDLGDFSSVEYLRFWLDAIRTHTGLRIFGYTHWNRDSDIGSVIEQESVKWDRFRIRFSDHHEGERTTHVIPNCGEQRRHRLGVVCPADDMRPHVSCGSCVLCVNSMVPVVFKKH